MKREIILASASPRRKDILEKTGLKFSVEPSDLGEDFDSKLSPTQIAESLSLAKAKRIASHHQNSLIIGSDTIVVLDGEILNKPLTKEEAEEMLKKLSGNTHSVISGFTVIEGDKIITGFEETKVRFRSLSKEEISEYIDTGEPMDKAGAYGIQGGAGKFVEAIEGDYFNIVGLPLFALSDALREFGIDISPGIKNLPQPNFPGRVE